MNATPKVELSPDAQFRVCYVGGAFVRREFAAGGHEQVQLREGQLVPAWVDNDEVRYLQASGLIEPVDA